MYDIPAIIFAGGKSSRMGTDKALLAFKGYKTMSEFQYRKLEKYFSSVYISSKENKFDFDCKLILDIQDESSPLVALVSVFEQLNIESIFVISVDIPLLDEAVIKKIFANDNKDYDAIIAESPNGLQPLCGIYHRSILSYAKTALKNDTYKLTKLLKEAHTYRVIFNKETPFTNLNHPEEYKALLFR